MPGAFTFYRTLRRARRCRYHAAYHIARRAHAGAFFYGVATGILRLQGDTGHCGALEHQRCARVTLTGGDSTSASTKREHARCSTRYATALFYGDNACPVGIPPR